MENIKVLITDPINPIGIKSMEDEGYQVTQKQDLSKEELLDIVADYDAIICRSSTPIDGDIIKKAKKLKCISITSTGWDTIDTDTADKLNIAVFGQPSDKEGEDVTRKGSFTPNAEHTILLMLALAGDFYNTVNDMKNGKWDKFNFLGTELLDKTIGIIGLGRIGQLVAKRAHSFEMKILAYNRDNEDKKKHLQLDFPVEFVSLEELCKRSDFITIHTPKTPETINLISKKQFDLMKKEAIVINTARGGIINEDDLLDVLKNKKIRGAGLDVFVNEGSDLNMDLISLPNVVATPHIAGVSKEGQERRSIATANNIIGFFKEGKIDNLVNNYNKS